MTTTELPETGAVLVTTDGPPDRPDEPRVDVRPGPVATRDADQYFARLKVRYVGATSSHRHSDVPGVVSVVRDWVTRPEAAGVRVGDRSFIRSLLAPGTLDRLERRLVQSAHDCSTLLVAWTSEGTREGDHDRYDRVLEEL